MQIFSGAEECVTLKAPGRHSLLRQVLLHPASDMHNNPVQELVFVPCRDGMEPLSGKLFYVESPIDRVTMVILSQSPDYVSAKVKLDDGGNVTVFPCGYPVTVETCPSDEAEQVTRQAFAKICPLPLFSLLNNWGDQRKGENLSEDFVRREIDAAQDMGIDVVQIDDGWQRGSTKDSRIYAPDGEYTFYHRFDGDFWEIDGNKFPDGLKPLVDYAAEKGVKMGLWFAPDSREHFGNAERDLEVLRKAYVAGFRYFKLDMVRVSDREDRDGFVRLLDAIHGLGEDVYLQMDVTGQPPRLGYADGCGFGKLFVENRYAAKKNDYFPYLTFRNLWLLSRYMPAQRLQMEFPNPYLFKDNYDSADPLAATHYSPDWIFASLLVSSPLIWMEAQNYAQANREILKPLVETWKAHRDALAKADVMPVGGCPDGTVISGFHAKGDGYGYFVLLRDVSREDAFTLKLPAQNGKIETLLASPGVTVENKDGCAEIRFPQQRQYAFCRYSV